jgi:hypothetical protein
MECADPIYQPRQIRRPRATKAGTQQRRDSLHEIIEAMRPMTVRQCFYQATVLGLVEKSEGGYNQVKDDLTKMRRKGTLPYDWLADNTRWQRRPRTFDSVEDALTETARLYRKALWRDVGAYVEIWIEKDALSGVIAPVTFQYDVPMMVARGYASLSFLHSAAQAIAALDVPAFIYHLGDFDPSGVNAAENIEARLREMAPNAEIHFERLAVMPWQITEWDLPSRPTKATDRRAKKFGSDISVELDAIEPERLRELVSSAIERHMPPDEFAILKEAEASERRIFSRLVDELGDALGA